MVLAQLIAAADAPAHGIEELRALRIEVVDLQDEHIHCFEVTSEDGGIMFAVGYDFHGNDGRYYDADERVDEAWAALDALLGLDVRDLSGGTEVSAGASDLAPGGAVQCALVGYDKLLVLRAAMVGAGVKDERAQEQDS